MDLTKYNREHKFGGMIVSGKWVYGNLSVLKQKVRNVEPGTYISNRGGAPFAYQVRPETVSEYIGYQDIQSTDIYENYILKDEYNRRLLVVWHRCGFCFKALTKTNFVLACDITQWFEDDTPRPEIIGNIFEKDKKE